jgi:signal peptidase II
LGVGIGLILWIWRQRVLPFWQALAAAALLGGTLGNGFDRWRLGYVVDFLALEPIDFPIFNGADVAINLAVLCFAIDFWTRRGDTSRG